ncbi:hypothetical protein VFPFJ_03976 [Purpureocillium lilacinum]|uniref:Secreted protein n=1 Tax=Purpureocillium lilacinum TaxID=33203 RepID=A0A179HP66_PURLI|nr:hypothetical protein VFPFJ_03976 [Purpureocillium lilacinum]OAQ92236.1 hypothetical protein VFPFJ_03976 [Purpureocillium lilacinum]
MPLIHGLIVTLARSPGAAATSGGGYGAAAFPAGGHAMPPRALAGFTFALQRGHLTSRVRWCSTTSFPVSYQARSTRARTCGAVVIKACGVVVRFGLVVVLPPSLAPTPARFPSSPCAAAPDPVRDTLHSSPPSRCAKHSAGRSIVRLRRRGTPWRCPDARCGVPRAPPGRCGAVRAID